MIRSRLPKYIATFIIVVSLSYSGASFANEKAASDFVSMLRGEILQVLKNNALDDKAKSGKLRTLFNKHVDTEWMSEQVIGRYKHQATEESMEKYKTLYHDYIMLSYLPRFKEFDGGDVVIERVNKISGSEYNVVTKFEPSNNDPDVRIDYLLIKQAGTFKVGDIKGEGISLVAKQSSDFGGLISRKGFDHFVGALGKKVKIMKKKTKL